MNLPAVRCKANSKQSGKQCKNKAIVGGTTCRFHGGSNPVVRAKAAVRAEVFSWGFTDRTVDPGETLLKLLSVSAERAQKYASELEALVAESPSLREALVAETWISTEHDSYKAGEYVRGLAVLEAQERDRCAGLAIKAIAAGLAEREVRLAERYGQMMASLVTGALADANLPPEISDKVRVAIASRMRELT